MQNGKVAMDALQSQTDPDKIMDLQDDINE